MIPSALYGCETWSQMTISDACESLLGLPKLSYEIDERKLYFLQKLIVMPESSITKQIF